MMNSRRNQISERCLTVKPAEARGHTAYCALKEPSLTALKVAEDATSAGLMLPNKREFMCCARQPTLRKWAANNSRLAYSPLVELEFNTEIG